MYDQERADEHQQIRTLATEDEEREAISRRPERTSALVNASTSCFSR
jgi:hypothetical protein